jgi:hypothetical protein
MGQWNPCRSLRHASWLTDVCTRDLTQCFSFLLATLDLGRALDHDGGCAGLDPSDLAPVCPQGLPYEVNMHPSGILSASNEIIGGASVL